MARKVGILTGGGDCPGLNAVIRAVSKSLILQNNIKVIGFEDGFDGLILRKTVDLTYDAVSGILQTGGTILGTSNKANPFRHAIEKNGKLEYVDKSKEVWLILKNCSWKHWSA
jgi:6-phosphofructokinase 1